MDLTSNLRFLMEMPTSKRGNDSKLILMKEAVETFIKRGIQSTEDVNEIQKCLDRIYSSDMLITKEVYEWAKEKTSSSQIVNVIKSPGILEKEATPLFCEDTVYHASLCCCAVCIRNATNYQEFFCKFEHHFDQLSFSTSDAIAQYLIARKGKTYYVAFLSEPSFSQWKKKKSVQHGK